MTFRMAVIGAVAAGLVLLGNGAYAAPLPGPSDRPVTVVNVYGDNNVIVADRSVLASGEGTRLNANAGDVSSSGTLGIDGKNSALSSGTSAQGTESTRGTETAPARTRRDEPAPIPVAGDGKGMAISGYEDHSVNVSGEDQIAVYDDSNLFINRNGQLNANTGDTDSSGLNAVDVSGSKVRSGNHTEDGENGDDDEDGPEENALPEAAPTEQTAEPTGTNNGTGGGSNGPGATGTVTDEGESSATGKSATTIGADGYDDLGTEVHGKRNVAVYDDSNVVVGGTGNVNAQIGDSDTSGAVVMGIDGSDVQAGNST